MEQAEQLRESKTAGQIFVFIREIILHEREDCQENRSFRAHENDSRKCAKTPTIQRELRRNVETVGIV